MNKNKKIIVGIIHYNSGNIGNLVKTVSKFTKNIIIVKNKSDFEKCNKIILPGVGSFGVAIDFLRKKKLIKCLKDYILKGGDTLGICLGMQILYKSSEEDQDIKGIGIIKKVIKRIHSAKENNVSVPHIGWNKVIYYKGINDELFKIIKGKSFYFSHSFAEKLSKKKERIAHFIYGENKYRSMILFKNLLALQFHPELSGKAGLEIFNYFLNKNK